MMTDLTYSHFDDDAVLTIQLANQSAWKLNHGYIDTEHILIGLCRSLAPETLAILAHFDVTTTQLMTELKRRVRRGHDTVEQGKRPVRPNAKRVTEHAVQVASRLDALAVHTNHLLLGMLHADGSIASDVLNTAGLDYDDVIASIVST